MENFPIALACLQYGNGDYLKTLKAGLFYGRDGETIAAVATSLLAAIQGKDIVPQNLKSGVDVPNKRVYSAIAQHFAPTVMAVLRRDLDIMESRRLLLQD